ncbi:hypothetical protein BBK82_25460 [Lentzea guizhouensis]|uniref:Clp R domain-containing protein n=1 Tax=Lentzea guizhouensis TaxID=1586287 RepID=A0A1B2HMG5_9PSEU|nr:hypothetical protein BBK82_25460 [Lentzea guizhouensis]
MKVLSAAVKRAVRLEFGRLGTENLVIALIDTTGPGRKLGVRSMAAQAMARGTEHWAGDDGGAAESHPDVTALVRTACHHARVETAPPVSRALDECLRAALAEAGVGVLTTTHLCVALLSLGHGRVADLFTVRRVDVGEVLAQVRAAAEPEEAPAVRMLRKSGALEGDSGGGYVRLLLRFVVRGQGLGGPVLPIVRGEADRLAVAAGRQDATAATSWRCSRWTTSWPPPGGGCAGTGVGWCALRRRCGPGGPGTGGRSRWGGARGGGGEAGGRPARGRGRGHEAPARGVARRPLRPAFRGFERSRC